MARIIWKENYLVSLKLKEDLYTIGQLLHSPVMRFFDIQSTDGIWRDIDLNKIDVLFEVNIGRVVLQKLAKERIKEKSVVYNKSPYEKFWIVPNISYKTKPLFQGGYLIKNDKTKCHTLEPPVKENLNVKEDLEIIKKYQLTNVRGDNHISDWLIRFFETGNKIDPFKESVFPELVHVMK